MRKKNKKTKVALDIRDFEVEFQCQQDANRERVLCLLVATQLG